MNCHRCGLPIESGGHIRVHKTAFHASCAVQHVKEVKGTNSSKENDIDTDDAPRGREGNEVGACELSSTAVN